MATLKPFQLSVTLGATEIRFPHARKAELCRDEKITLPVKIKDGKRTIQARSFGYRFIKYSGDLYSVEEPGLYLEHLANEVLRLITPARRLTQEEKDSFGVENDFPRWMALNDLDSEEVAAFLTRYGMVGLGNYTRRDNLNQVKTPRDFISKVGIPYKYLPVLEKEFKLDPASLPRRISRIVKGDEIPFKWIEDDLRILARCIRMIHALDQNGDSWQEGGVISLKRGKELRRIIHAWRPVFAIPDDLDPGLYLPTKDLWIHKNPEQLVQEFVSAMNAFLKPLSSNAILSEKLREIQDQNFGLETALISYLFLNKANALHQKPCKYAKCGRLFFPVRVTKEFCSDTCGTNDRVARKRARDKDQVFASRAESKTKPKARKEKK